MPPNPSVPSTLQTEGLVKEYGGRRVVDQVSISLDRGEIVGLLGPNGAGKTTTFNMVVGIVKPLAGRILLEGADITKLPLYKRARIGLGYLAQEKSVFSKLTVEDNILAVLQVIGLRRAEQRSRLNALLEDLGIAHLARNLGNQLSGGERRRLEIARALASKPKFMLLDEPFSGVDPKAVEEIQKIIHKMRDSGLGILITDHSVRETLEVTDRSYIIHEGKIRIAGTAAQIVNDPDARELYLGESFYMNLSSERKGGRSGNDGREKDGDRPQPMDAAASVRAAEMPDADGKTSPRSEDSGKPTPTAPHSDVKARPMSIPRVQELDRSAPHYLSEIRREVHEIEETLFDDKPQTHELETSGKPDRGAKSKPE